MADKTQYKTRKERLITAGFVGLGLAGGIFVGYSQLGVEYSGLIAILTGAAGFITSYLTNKRKRRGQGH